MHPLGSTGNSAAARRRVAVVGSGVAGLTAGYVLSRRCDVTLFEADARPGGHAHTHAVPVAGRTVAVDTGFIVHNDRTYPTLTRLFEELGVETQDSDMSMSVRCDEIGLEYAGARGLAGIFAQPRNLGRPAYLRMLGEVLRFHRMARGVLAAADGSTSGDETMETFLRRGRFSPFFTTYFMRPLVGTVWSCDPAVALEYPARYLFTFLDHHGMLTVLGSPTWRTVVGGSARYVERVAALLHEVRLSTPVSAVREVEGGVEVTDARGACETFAAVVIATHPHQSLAMLSAPSDAQRDVLAAMPYSTNVAQLHTDESVLPRNERARASWNYLRRPSGEDPGRVLVSYDMTRLQRITVVTDRRFIVTLGGQDLVDPDAVIDTMRYEHPLYTPESLAAQRRLPEINTARLAFAGAYHGWGFHEDGALSGLRAAEHLGVGWHDAPSARNAVTVDRVVPSGEPDLVTS